MVLVAE